MGVDNERKKGGLVWEPGKALGLEPQSPIGVQPSEETGEGSLGPTQQYTYTRK
jgi:hypothetical protein